jgi:predicted DNA-binding WGR domain protein
LRQGDPRYDERMAAVKPKKKPAAAKKRRRWIDSSNFRRHFERRTRTSKRFWEVELARGVLTLRWGVIGNAGQTSTKAYSVPILAEFRAKELIKQKRRLGFKELK